MNKKKKSKVIRVPADLVQLVERQVAQFRMQQLSDRINKKKEEEQ